jgi:acetyl-CoA carboxylase biotin carboxyl carrier protein
MTWTLEEIRELIRVVTDTGVAELEVQRGEDRVRIRRSSGSRRQEILLPPQAGQAEGSAPFPAGSDSSHVSQSAPGATAAGQAETDALADPNLVTVKSPIVGTFYESSSPTAPPFVKVGDTVHTGQVLCIIESMKLMNEIEAEMSGVIMSRLVSNSQPVEYGESLFVIRPS